MQADARQIFVHTTEDGKQPAGFLNRRTFPDIFIAELAGNRERGEAATAPVPPVLRYREDMRDVNGKMSGWECSVQAVCPAEVGWIPACAGMTMGCGNDD